MHEGKSLKFGGSMDYDMTMNQLDFGIQRSRSPQDQKWAKFQFWGHYATLAASFIPEKTPGQH